MSRKKFHVLQTLQTGYARLYNSGMVMKQWKVIVLIAVFVLSGCATVQQQRGENGVAVADSPYVSGEFTRVLQSMASLGMADKVAGYRVLVISNSEDINAWVNPKAKRIYFTQGMVNVLSPGELDCVLGHEIAHIELGHWEKAMGVSVGTSIALTIAGIFVPGVGYADYIVNPLVTSGFSRSQEVEADLYSVRLMKLGLGYSPQVCIDEFEKVLTIVRNKREGDGDKTGWLDSHPNMRYRIDKIREYAEEQGWE
ncbi:MAG: Metalloprotease LoiP precursor [Syntrophorhabdus sp. PtaU1.Bin002]|nr:MAG: Metalloprotease LoiP precursor [Syntrophorhabdus sp. PtaB.Bin006]OPY66274.1 MAG: Metalloprotease LoiP precursor [Syntrophorhabdus sp. PtaU1.Bin002]